MSTKIYTNLKKKKKLNIKIFIRYSNITFISLELFLFKAKFPNATSAVI